ncbi:MAG: phosphotransferase family protein [Actinomycetota bacterium]
MIETELARRWIESVVDAPIERLEPMPGGGSRAMSILDLRSAGPRARLVVRTETGGGPFAGTELGSLEREADVYRALEGSGLPVPVLIGVAPDGRSLIATRLAGSNDYTGIADPEEKSAVRRDYLDRLAALHALDPERLDLPRLQRPGGAGGQARAWLQVWSGLFGARVKRPAPVLRFAIAWLDEHAPPDAERTVVCHGDVGPGNFVHEGGHVTGLLDWELCHLGDFHDDLGMLALRAHQLNGFGDLTEDLEYYEKVSGQRIDAGRVRYFRAVALVLGLTTSIMQLDGRGEGRVQVPLYLHLVPTLELLLIRALADLLGFDVAEPDTPQPLVDPVGRDVAGAIREALTDVAAAGDVVRTAGALDLVAHLDAAARIGPAVDALDLDEVEAVIGRRPATYLQAVAEVDASIASGSVDPEAFLLWAFRSARRRVALWPAWAPVMETPLLPL